MEQNEWDHLHAIIGQDHRTRLVGLVEAPIAGVDRVYQIPRFVILCARSEACAVCQRIIERLRETGTRIVDIGVLSPIEVQRVRP